jgi:transposase InsO family protein
MSARPALQSTWLGGGEGRHRAGGPFFAIILTVSHRWTCSSCRHSPSGCCMASWSCGTIDVESCGWGVTANPRAEWIARQLTGACGREAVPDDVVLDRDCAYGEAYVRRLRAMGIRDRPTAPRSPWQNAYAERLIGSIRREVLDHIVVLGERHLRHVLLSYMTYYNEARTHLSLKKDAPIPREVQSVGRIFAKRHLGGLHHQYVRI